MTTTSERRAIADIRIGARHRTDMGDLRALASSIKALGLLQPVGILEDLTLVFGHRRILACQLLGHTEIDVRIVNVASIAMGEMAENELRKQFTPSERVAIFRTIETAGKGANLRTQVCPRGDILPVLTTDDAAKRSGFAGRGTAYRAVKVVDKGIPEVVQAMDDGHITITMAESIATHPPEEQAPLLAKARTQSRPKPPPKVPPKAPAKPKRTPQKPIDISHIVGHPPTLSKEEAGITPDMTWEEEAQHQEKYGKAQIVPKAIRDMNDARAMISYRTDSLEMLLSDIRPDPETFFTNLNAMLQWTTDQRKPGYTGHGWETDYAKMARKELATLRRLLPQAIELLQRYRIALSLHDSCGIPQDKPAADNAGNGDQTGNSQRPDQPCQDSVIH